MLPFGWTAETLLGSHSSKPYNPDIARVFYRAGYIESWGRGIQKIRDACKHLRTDEPEYMVHGEDIMVKFKALQSAKVTNSNVPNVTKDCTMENATVTTTEMADYLSMNRRAIQRGLDALKHKGIIERKGGKRYGYWEVKE